MIRKPQGYDEVQVNDREYVPFEIGGHICIIKKAELYKNQTNGKESIKLYLDTDVTDRQPKYFENEYKNDTRPEKKWNNNAIMYLSLGMEEAQLRQLKSGMTAIENSNPNYHWNWDETTLTNKKVGVVFGLEEYVGQDGRVRTRRKAIQLRSANKVLGVKEPNVKLAYPTKDGRKTMSYDDYMEYKEAQKDTPQFPSLDEAQTDMTDLLPF